MKTIRVQVKKSCPTVHVDNFPAKCDRSGKGSIKITPGLLMVTEGELQHIRTSRPDLVKHLIASKPAPVKEDAKPVEPAAPAVSKLALANEDIKPANEDAKPANETAEATEASVSGADANAEQPTFGKRGKR
jgi:hypothetical protein